MKAVFARRDPHGDILRSVAGRDADPDAVPLREMLSVVWVSSLKQQAKPPQSRSDRSEAAFAASDGGVPGLKNFEWARDVLCGGSGGRGGIGGIGGRGGGGGSFPLFCSPRDASNVGGAAAFGFGNDNAHMYYTSGEARPLEP